MKKGFSLIEILLAVAIFSMVAGFFISLMIESYKINSKARDLDMATNLAVEGIEAVRSIRDVDYNELGKESQTYCLAIKDGRWILVEEPKISEQNKDCLENTVKFTRQIIISSALSGRKIISSVSWAGIGGTKKIELYSLVTDWR